jgi:hypothetical protein
MFPAAFARRVALALVVCCLALCACGDKKKEAPAGAEDAAAARAEPEPAPARQRSFFAEACEKHSDAAKKADCLCRVDVLDSMLSAELLAKLETLPEGMPARAVAEHLGGMANLSKVYEGMRKASNDCQQGASK